VNIIAFVATATRLPLIHGGFCAADVEQVAVVSCVDGAEADAADAACGMGCQEHDVVPETSAMF
jgi:hypothetical protein